MHKAPYDKKAAVIKGKLNPAALYGCDTTPANEAALRSYRAAVVDTVAYTTRRRAADLVFAFCSRGEDIDPDVEITVRRVLALRRLMSTNSAAA